MEKIVRTVCLFSTQAGQKEMDRLGRLETTLIGAGYSVQTKRICLNHPDAPYDETELSRQSILLGLGSLRSDEFQRVRGRFLSSDNAAINLDLTRGIIGSKQVEILFQIIAARPAKTFEFAYTFHGPASTPYFPSARYQKEGFSLGLQPTNLAAGCDSLDEWLDRLKSVWNEIATLFHPEPDFLGIDSSVAPLFEGDSSLVHFTRRLKGSFSASVTTDFYTRLTRFIKEENPYPVGLCGLMLPCLEDFELAEEYENGNLTLERNLFLSLHSGLGIDTYPIGIDERKERVLEILRLTQALSNKYQKPLAIRFVSDGKARIGQKTDFQNPYLKDVTVRPL
ncbi:DUF711 family protein [Patescibacteria group bacterium]|nr:DUF711 family protein [Patescibacteria group bacterium]